MKGLLFPVLAGISLAACSVTKGDEELPNILWLSTEDLGPEIGCYGDKNAHTPVIDELASRGVLYANAYVTAPVSAPCRSGIITGMYAPSIGSQHMRCTGVFPESLKYFPQYMRERGYYCTNNSKTDYNLKFDVKVIWDESSGKAHWRNRKDPGKPFFAVFNFLGTHESYINEKKNHLQAVEKVPVTLLKKPGEIPLPPYFPDTPEVNELWTRYYNNMTALDFWVKDLLSQLKEDGLEDNTIIVFFGDHGSGVPRHKRWLYDSGIRVPLIVYVPEKYRHFMPHRQGQSTDELVSLVDLAPTALNLAGIPIPGHMQGRAFLGKNLTPERKYIFAARDRMDERYDMQRAVRDKRFKYIRYYEPAKPFTQYMNTPEKGAIMMAIREAYKNGSLPEAGKKMMEPVKPEEELFDVLNDPYELNNLAADPAYKDKLEELRKAHTNWSSEIYDSGLIPETILRTWEARYNKPIYSILREENIPVRDIQMTALSTDPGTLLKALSHENEAVRYWGATNSGNQPWNNMLTDRISLMLPLLKDSIPAVRMAAARAVCKISRDKRAGLEILRQELKNPGEWVRLYAAQVLDELGETSRPLIPELMETMKDKNIYVVRVVNHTLNQLTGQNVVVP